jgi:heptaprenyl diphosphate synthase
MKKLTASKLTLLALLTAFSLVLFMIEAQIPPFFFVPIPGIKLGLANIITLFILYSDIFKKRDAVIITIVRILLSGLITGNLFALLFSFAGGITAVFTMIALHKFLPIFAASVAGAIAHNAAQIAVAVFISGSSALLYLPILVFAGILSGLLTGFTVTIIITRLRRNNHGF